MARICSIVKSLELGQTTAAFLSTIRVSKPAKKGKREKERMSGGHWCTAIFHMPRIDSLVAAPNDLKTKLNSVVVYLCDSFSEDKLVNRSEDTGLLARAERYFRKVLRAERGKAAQRVQTRCYDLQQAALSSCGAVCAQLVRRLDDRIADNERNRGHSRMALNTSDIEEVVQNHAAFLQTPGLEYDDSHKPETYHRQVAASEAMRARLLAALDENGRAMGLIG
ncbi:MAG TPA: hypothetical protein VFS42_11690 [Burkholderiaceae bacterium]|nr:hypothetical protein [Burkholderiaceae bacterium]